MCIKNIPLVAGTQSFEKVNTGVDTDRVYLLRFQHSSRRHFFWIQDADCSKDACICVKINKLLGNGIEKEFYGSPIVHPVRSDNLSDGAFKENISRTNGKLIHI